jgi:transcription antitermination protein NusB
MASDAEGRPRRRAGDAHEAEREGRRLALSAIFEADFGQRTAGRALDRQVELGAPSAAAVDHARVLVDAVVRHRDTIDARIERAAPAYPVVSLARIDRALLRSALGELLHCAATPPRVAISEWVELARTYSGEPARRLLNGVLGRIAEEATDAGQQATIEPRPAGGSTPPIKEDPE